MGMFYRIYGIQSKKIWIRLQNSKIIETIVKKVMFVDLISKTSSDQGSTPCISTQVRHLSLTRHVSAVFPGMTGFDGLQVWVRENMMARNGKTINMFQPQLKAVA